MAAAEEFPVAGQPRSDDAIALTSHRIAQVLRGTIVPGRRLGWEEDDDDDGAWICNRNAFHSSASRDN
uniref:Uncharacterized protein n=1 Tax=Oryza punctata TaxID=4537 RepID=A0A0E0JT62_ORYPU